MQVFKRVDKIEQEEQRKEVVSQSVAAFQLGEHQQRAIHYLCKHPKALLAMAT